MTDYSTSTQSPPMGDDELLGLLKRTCDDMRELETLVDNRRKQRDRLIVRVIDRELMGYRKLAALCHLTPGRIQQIVKLNRKLERIFGRRV